MSKFCQFAVVMAAVHLPVILLSLQAGAQSTIDETTSDSSTFEEAVHEIKEEIKDMKQQLFSSSPTKCNGSETSKQALVSALVCEYRNSASYTLGEIGA